MKKSESNVTKKPQKNDFDKSLEARHQFNSYKTHFRGLYQFVNFLCWVLLCASAFFSAKFFGSWFSQLGEPAIYIGFFISGLVALLIHVLTEKTLVYYDSQKTVEPLLSVILVGLLVLNVYGDLEGSAEWGTQLAGEAPTDTKTARLSETYTNQIDAIAAEIDAIEAENFYWCGVHRAAHKCDVPSNKPYINKSESSDIKALADIEKLENQRSELRATMNSLLSQAGAEFTANMESHANTVSRNKGRLRGASLACMTLFMLLSMWSHKYGKKAVQESPLPSPTPEPEPERAPKEKQKRKPSKAEKKRLKEARKKEKELEAFLQEQARENSDLREELAALKESEARGK